MANPTSNFGWQMPTNTDLVKDLPADFEVFGQAVDTSLMDLKGGTTGQVLSKASNTDMDFTWVTSDDANAIQNTIVDAKGDLISASAADVPARLAVGNNGESLVADSSATTGLRWQGNFAAGKNKIINGDFNIWQRGTTFTNLATGAFACDRWRVSSSNTTIDVTRSAFTPGTAPVAGYEAKYFATIAAEAADTDPRFQQPIEDVTTFAGQTVTVSFWAKSTVTTDALRWIRIQQNFGTSGSAGVNTDSAAITLSGSWTRYSVTLAVPSISGKTIGTAGDNLLLIFGLKASTAQTLDLWGVQVEAGNVATAFQTATGTLAGELAACQRYYYRQVSSASNTYAGFAFGFASSTTIVDIPYKLAQTMRVPPTSVEFANLAVSPDNANLIAVTNLAVVATENSADSPIVRATVTGATQFRPYGLFANNSASAYVGFSAEL